VIAVLQELAGVGVSWVTVGFPGDTRAEQLASIDRFAPIVSAAAAL
jgi:hypothetical protein